MVKSPAPAPAASFRALYEAHFAFVWRSLRHLGVRAADISDACQDVFLVVHRRLPEFEARGKLTTWLFQICVNHARDRRRRAHARSEILGDAVFEHALTTDVALLDPTIHQDQLSLFHAALERMDFEQRAAFILFEVEGMTGPEAARALGLPLATAYSRLRLAREAFVAIVERIQRADQVSERPHARRAAR